MNVVQIPGSSPVVQPQQIKARGLPYRKMTKLQRALLLRDIVRGEVQLRDFSVRQLAEMIGLSSTCAYAVVRLQPDDCEDVRRGLRPLILREPKEPTMATTPRSPRERLNEIVCEIGFDEILSLLAANEKAAAAA